MDWLFALLISFTFLLSLVISSLIAILVWIAFPDVIRYQKTMFFCIIILSLIMTDHYRKGEYNPDKHYQTLKENWNEQEHDDQGRPRVPVNP